MTYFNLKKLREYEYDYGRCCQNCRFAKIRLGIQSNYVNWCMKHESQINHVFVCNEFGR